MANTAALLQNLLRCKADYNYAILQQTLWASRSEKNASKLAAQQSAETKYYEAYDDACDVAAGVGDKESLRAKGKEVVKGSSDLKCREYADAKSGYKFEEEALYEYADLDTEYSLMVSTFDAMVAQLDSMISNYEEQVGTAAADTGRLQGG